MKKSLIYSSSYTEHVSALTFYLVNVFYTLKDVLSEMIEIVPPYHNVLNHKQKKNYFSFIAF
jgi:hypothetical protein